MTHPIVRTNPAESPHQWWEEILRAEAAQGEIHWAPNQLFPHRNPNEQVYISNGLPGVVIPIPHAEITLTAPTPHQGRAHNAQTQQQQGSTSQPNLIMHQVASQSRYGFLTEEQRLRGLNTAQTLPSLRDIMAEQNQQQKTAIQRDGTENQTSGGNSPKTYANLRVLDRSHYLVLLASVEERENLFNAGPQYINGRFVEIIPWTPDYDTTTLTKKWKPAWVTIAGLSPSLENEGRKMLEKTRERCYVCHEVGHVAKFCPKTTTTREVSKEELDEAIKAAARKVKEAEPDGTTEQGPTPEKAHLGSTVNLQPEKTKTKQDSGKAPGIPTTNPFDILGEENEEEEPLTDSDMGDAEETPQPTIRIGTPDPGSTDQGLDLNIAVETRTQTTEAEANLQKEEEEDTEVIKIYTSVSCLTTYQ
ncbi:hypothetical protein R1sor_014317 [Riccia sorocarpa]|uniref:CCHC-type domain-containing protein n=1 Tax=Riccia sorocarpa TaxID=122646 RepID=A0ABD3H921_9MARC